MILQPHEAEQFYRIWWPLLSYVNQQEGLIADFPNSPENESIKPEDAVVVRDRLWESNQLLQAFIDNNPAKLSADDLMLAASWKNRVADNFIVMKHLKNHSVFLQETDNPTVYGVIGIYSSIDEMIPFSVPFMVNAVLLPFGDKIISDSLIMPYQVRFGSNMRKGFNEQLRYAQEAQGIVTALNSVIPVQAIIDGNQKILTAFLKSLAKQGMSEKMQSEHYANVKNFVDLCLSAAAIPRSLLKLDVSDLDNYFKTSNKKPNLVSFKRLNKFLFESNRIDWDTHDEIQAFLKSAKSLLY